MRGEPQFGLFDEEDGLVPHEERLPYQRESETSREAAATKSRESADSQRMRVFRYVLSRGNHGATRDEVRLGLDLEINVVCPRVWELVKRARLYETSTKRVTEKGRSAFVLIVPERWRNLDGSKEVREWCFRERSRR